MRDFSNAFLAAFGKKLPAYVKFLHRRSKKGQKKSLIQLTDKSLRKNVINRTLLSVLRQMVQQHQRSRETARKRQRIEPHKENLGNSGDTPTNDVIVVVTTDNRLTMMVPERIEK
jgi:hypothetical protein